MASPKPTFLLIPGVCHTPSHFARLTTCLEELSFHVKAISLPSVDSSTPFAESLSKDSAHEIILVSHSYGGLPGSTASKGLMKSELEAQGKRGGILGQIYIAAFLAPEGKSLLDMAGGKHAPWVIKDKLSGTITPNDPTTAFFADAPVDVAEEAVAQLKASATACTETPAPVSGIADSALDEKRVYIMCMQDQALPVRVQELVLKWTEVEWEIIKMESGHCPMVSRPEELAKVLFDAVERFTS